MKKAIVFITVLCLLLSSFAGTVNAQAAAAKTPPLTMQILGKKVSTASPIDRSGKIYLPLRIFGEQLGYLVSWDAKAQTMTLKKGTNTMKVTINNSYGYIDGKKTKLSAVPIMYNSRLYVYIDFAQKYFNYTTTYDKTKNVVTVSAKTASTASAANTKAIYLFGKKLDTKDLPAIISGKLFVPYRTFGEGLQYQVTYDSKTQTMELKNDDITAKLTVGKKTGYVDGKAVTLDDTPVMYNSKVYAPLSFIIKYFNYDIDYDKTKVAVWVNKKIINTPAPVDTIKYETANIQDISYSDEGGFPQLDIQADKPIKFTSSTMTNPDRLVIDISDSIVATDFESKEINQGGVIRARIGQYLYNPEKIVRVVIDLENPKTCKVVQSDDKKTVSLIYANVVKPVQFTKEGSKDVLVINGSDTLDTSIQKLSDPDRLVVDVKRSVLEQAEQTIQSNTALTRSVRTGQFDVGTARVVLDLQPNVFYEVRPDGKTAKVYISDAPFSFVDYDRDYNTAYAELSPGNEVEYQTSVDEENRILNIMIPGDLEVEQNKYNINDNIIEYMEVKKETHDDSTFTVASFKMKNMVQYELLSPSVSKVVKLKFKYTPKTADQLTILIDPGHGGKDPGAVGVGGVQEKDLTLDVSLRLDRILKGLGFKTIVTRTDDRYVDLATRANTANNNYVDFFMCIHFNAFTSSAKGIETLYYPNTVTAENPQDNKKMAQIFHNELIGALKRPSRGITPRPGLYVLNKTKMPAILAELGFITNTEEYSQIKTEQYKETAARALAVSIIKYFEEMQGMDLNIDTASIYSAPMPGAAVNTVQPAAAQTQQIAPEAATDGETGTPEAPIETNNQ